MGRTRRRGAFGCILEKGPKLFCIRWREGSIHRRQSGFKSKTEAAEALARIRTKLSNGTLAKERKASIGFDKAAEEWLDLHSKVNLRSHSLNVENYKRHVEPFFGDAPLSTVTAKRILELRAKLAGKNYRRKRRGEDDKVTLVAKKLSKRTVNLVMALVRSILKFAVVLSECEDGDSNPDSFRNQNLNYPFLLETSGTQRKHYRVKWS